MIFVTVGTHQLHFERLIREMDSIASKVDEDVIAQIGSSTYQPKYMKYFDFTSEEEMVQFFNKSRIIVTHAGAGTLLNTFTFCKPLIVIPRLKKFKEVIDDHQLELAQVINKNSNVIIVNDINNLEQALKKADTLTTSQMILDSKLVNFLKKYIETMKK